MHVVVHVAMVCEEEGSRDIVVVVVVVVKSVAHALPHTHMQ